MSDKPVFSTDQTQTTKGRKSKGKKDSYVAGEGPIKARLEKKGRGGKTVIVLTDLPMSEQEAKQLKRDLQGQLACGATLKNSSIELRGDSIDETLTLLQRLGFKAVRAGG
jgi:translation initiation factor 1